MFVKGERVKLHILLFAVLVIPFIIHKLIVIISEILIAVRTGMWKMTKACHLAIFFLLKVTTLEKDR